MNEHAKITASHLSRQAIVYLRQSSAAQVENNRESTERQYALAAKARELGWSADRIVVIDEDLGLSGSGSPAPPRSRTIANRPSDNMRWPPKHENLVGRPIVSSSSTRTSGSPAPAL